MERHFVVSYEANRLGWDPPPSFKAHFYLTTASGGSRWDNTHAQRVETDDPVVFVDSHVITQVAEHLQQALLEASRAHHFKMWFYTHKASFNLSGCSRPFDITLIGMQHGC